MPQLGSNKNPIILNGSKKKKSTRVLGLLGHAYSGEAKQKYKITMIVYSVRRAFNGYNILNIN